MALFSKKKQQKQPVEEQVVATTKPTVKQRIGNAARQVAQKTGLADKAQQVNERVQKAKDKAMRTYIIFSLMGAFSIFTVNPFPYTTPEALSLLDVDTSLSKTVFPLNEAVVAFVASTTSRVITVGLQKL